MAEEPTQLALVSNLPTAPARARGTRLDRAWVPDPVFHREHGWTDAQANYELEKFRDHWCAKAGAGATKLDWDATWRNWLRKAAEMGQGPRSGGGATAWTPSTTTERVGTALRLADQLRAEGR